MGKIDGSVQSVREMVREWLQSLLQPIPFPSTASFTVSWGLSLLPSHALQQNTLHKVLSQQGTPVLSLYPASVGCSSGPELALSCVSVRWNA